MTTVDLLKKAKAAKPIAAALTTAQKNLALERMAEYLVLSSSEILVANELDIQAAKQNTAPVMLDRLRLTGERIDQMAKGIRDISALSDPVGEILEERELYNGLELKKVTVPVGVVALIYESRPNVTSDAAALSVKSGNVCVLRGGKEAINSNRAIVRALKKGLKSAGVDDSIINLVTDTDRKSSIELMEAVGLVDMLIPRGGKGLIRACVENSKVPCIETGSGVCHVYIHGDADMEMAVNIIENAKCSRPSVCNAAEICLIDESILAELLPKMYQRLVTDRAERGETPVKLIGDTKISQHIKVLPAIDSDFDTEFLDYVMAIKAVSGVKEAVAHIRSHSTGHSESIVTESAEAAQYFLNNTDSAAVYHNASTRFTDGGEFGLGCEMGISTQKLHARGPMGLKEMTSYKYVIRGNGQVR